MGARPHLRVLDVGLDEHEEISTDGLSIIRHEEFKANDYHLGKYRTKISLRCSLVLYVHVTIVFRVSQTCDCLN